MVWSGVWITWITNRFFLLPYALGLFILNSSLGWQLFEEVYVSGDSVDMIGVI